MELSKETRMEIFLETKEAINSFPNRLRAEYLVALLNASDSDFLSLAASAICS